MQTETLQRPYVVSWNLTYRCNLACEHCYLDAGPRPKVATPAFADRGELSTEECFDVASQIAEFAPESLTILTGGEPLLRRDILEIIEDCVAKDLWVVVGTNGVKITETLAEKLKAAGVRGLALSLDALDAETHDRFRGVRGAWRNTVEGARILERAGLPFLLQTTVGRHNREALADIAAFACDELRARVWNVYFLVPTGRGAFVSDIGDAEYDEVLRELVGLQREYRDRMLVNAKCAPHLIRVGFEESAGSPFPRAWAGGQGGCPAGTQYMGIRPNGDLTPCPYLPEFAGNLREDSLRDLWTSSELFERIRDRSALGGKCGDCEFASTCGGCRARAWSATGDVLSEDPLCTHVPTGDTADVPVPPVTYGVPDTPGTGGDLAWDAAADERMKAIPAFVRGMVRGRVENWCRERGISRVTVDVLAEIRSRMPTPRFFS